MSKPNRIMIVDDEADLAGSSRRILRLAGYDVAVANSGEEAVEMAEDYQPDGILMDLRMPGMSGVDAWHKIRDICPGAFVIFMTAFSGLIDEAKHADALGVLIKPFDPNELFALVASGLGAGQ